MAKILNPKLTIIDGSYALDGHGPMYGTAKKTNLLISSNNLVAADTVGATVMGIPIAKANNIVVASEAGLGTTNLEQIRINESLQKYKMQFSVNRTLIDNLSLLLFNSETMARLVMCSPITPLVYKLAIPLRNQQEREVASQISHKKPKLCR
jgi:hypothetical protein